MKVKIKNEYLKLGKNVGFLTIGNFASKILNFLLVPLYTAKLTTEEYGTADLLFTTVSLLIPIVTLQINEGLMRFTLDKKDDKQVFSTGFYINVIGSLLFLLCSPILLLFNDVKEYYFFFVLLFLSTILYTCISQYAKGVEKVREYSIAGVINTFVVVIFNIFFLLIVDYKIQGYLLSYILGYFISGCYLLYKLKIHKQILFINNLDKRLVKKMLLYSAPLIPNAICWWANNSADKYILALFHSTSAVGILAVAYKIPSLLSMMSTIFFSAWQISAVDDFGTEKNRKFYSDIFRGYFIFNIFVSLMLVAFAKILGGILYSNDFFVAWKITIILVISCMFNAMSAFLGSIYTTAKRTRMLFLTSILSTVVNIIFNFAFIPAFGALGAAGATLVSYVIIFVIRLWHAQTIMKLYIRYKESIMMILLLFLISIITFFEFEYAVLLSSIMIVIFMVYILGNINYKKIYKNKENDTLE